MDVKNSIPTFEDCNNELNTLYDESGTLEYMIRNYIPMFSKAYQYGHITNNCRAFTADVENQHKIMKEKILNYNNPVSLSNYYGLKMQNKFHFF